MLIAIALLAVIDAVPSPKIELALTGTAGGPPVSAAPRSLSDVARERREGRIGVGCFSAVETTVPRNPSVVPALDWEDEATEAEPEVVTQPPPAYVTTYLPAGYGGRPRSQGVRRRPVLHVAGPGAGPRPATRPPAPPTFQMHLPAGRLRRPS